MDAATLGQLIDRYAPALVLYARQWCAAPEDVVQDAFLALMARAVVPDPVAPWLFRVVRNRAISTARTDRRRRRREQAAGSRRSPWFHADPAGELDAASLRDALAELPGEQREVIVAHLWGGLTFEQVGELAGCSTSMVYRRYVAGVEALRAPAWRKPMSGETDDLTAFARALADVAPYPGRLDRDALLFAAGRAAGRRGAFWPVTAAALAVLSAALAATLATRTPAIVEVERIVYIPTPKEKDEGGRMKDEGIQKTKDDPGGPDSSFILHPSSFSSEPALIEGLRLRQSVLRDGVDTLPRPPREFSSPSSTDAPDLSSLRLNASHPDRGKVQ